MKKLLIVISSLMLVLTAGTVMAQEDWGFNAGDKVLTLQGSGTSDDDLDNTVFSAEGGLSYFLNEVMSVGLRQGVSYADIPGGDDNIAGSTRGFLDWHLDLARSQPFLGANFGYLYGDQVNDSFIAGLEGGIKYFLVPTTFLYGLIEYNFTFEDADEADEAFDDGRFVYALGLGYKF